MVICWFEVQPDNIDTEEQTETSKCYDTILHLRREEHGLCGGPVDKGHPECELAHPISSRQWDLPSCHPSPSLHPLDYPLSSSRVRVLKGSCANPHTPKSPVAVCKLAVTQRLDRDGLVGHLFCARATLN